MKILVIDDHALFREGLVQLLTWLDDDVELIQAESFEAGLERACACADFDLVLIDINLPGLSGLEGLQVFRRRFPDYPVVVLTGSDSGESMRESFSLGAQGYIHKSASADAMLDALRKVLAGEIGLCPPPTAGLSTLAPQTPPRLLTPRQSEVLALLCTGRSDKEISSELALSDNAVRVHLAAIFRMLGAKTRAQAAMLARQEGWV